jgi:uncharacterized membrane protein YfcA
LQLEIPILGFLVGLLVGMSGMGGGSLMTPLLILLFGVNPLTAVGTDLTYMAMTKSVGAVQHYRQRTIDLSLAKYLVAGGAPASMAGIAITTYLNLNLREFLDLLIKRSVGLTLLVAAAFLIYAAFRWRRNTSTLPKTFEVVGGRRKILAFTLGSLLGFTVSLTSVGSGTLLMPFLILVYGIAPKKLVGTDIFFAAIITLVSGVAYFYQGVADPKLLILLVAGSMPGVLLGSKFNHRAPPRIVKVVLASVMVLAAAALIVRG